MKASTTNYALIILIGLVLIAAGLLALGQCGGDPPMPTPVVVTATSTPVRITATSTPKPSISPSATFLPPTATVTPEKPPETPTATFTPTPATPIPTVALLGTHIVRRGETMYEIALAWEPRRWFLWAEHAWRPICDANPQVIDCRMIFVGDVLKVPRLR